MHQFTLSKLFNYIQLYGDATKCLICRVWRRNRLWCAITLYSVLLKLAYLFFSSPVLFPQLSPSVSGWLQAIAATIAEIWSGMSKSEQSRALLTHCLERHFPNKQRVRSCLLIKTCRQTTRYQVSISYSCKLFACGMKKRLTENLALKLRFCAVLLRTLQTFSASKPTENPLILAIMPRKINHCSRNN